MLAISYIQERAMYGENKVSKFYALFYTNYVCIQLKNSCFKLAIKLQHAKMFYFSYLMKHKNKH